MTKTSENHNPALKGLEILVGDWEMELSNARFLPSPSAKIMGSARFEWIEDGEFLVMRQGMKKVGPPYSNSVIGRDESEDGYTMLYFDDRSVSRIYSMSFKNGEWRQWRDQPGFQQRFIGKISPDGNTISASWELSEDGKTWQHDFDLNYRRKNVRG